ncbi:hypothetical protein BU16DRAFT_5825 [Lophium mytilinum]|uniref:Uncharacterized protein n=1 Tax=Lophium mytilinum TaxID=390894 RepID=A0A6A6RFW1_9PEZI|nr:hypothetical protein BU16DRAFT_5825 [Lophium mytilinum]
MHYHQQLIPDRQYQHKPQSIPPLPSRNTLAPGSPSASPRTKSPYSPARDYVIRTTSRPSSRSSSPHRPASYHSPPFCKYRLDGLLLTNLALRIASAIETPRQPCLVVVNKTQPRVSLGARIRKDPYVARHSRHW